MGSGRGWLAGDWPSTGGVLNITAAAWTAGFQWWHSGDTAQTQNVSEYMHVLALCLLFILCILTATKELIFMTSVIVGVMAWHSILSYIVTSKYYV